MRHYILKNKQQANGGFTDLFVLTNADLTQTTSNTAQSVKLTTLVAGDFVGNNMLCERKTAVAGLTTCTMAVGITGATTQFVAATNVLAAGSSHFTQAGSVAPYVGTASKDLLATFTPGASEALSAATAGEIWVWAQISRATDRDITA